MISEEGWSCKCGHPMRDHGDRAVVPCANWARIKRAAGSVSIVVHCAQACQGFSLNTQQLAEMTRVDAEPAPALSR